jgi:hypothetical protein
MNEEVRQEFHRLITDSNCTNNYLCIFETGDDLGEVRYHVSSDLQECIYKQQCSCEHSIKVNSTYICKCQLREFLAINLKEISKYN